MSEREELIKRLRKWECGIKFGDETGIPLDSIALLKLIADCLSALTAQQSQQEPTEPVAGDVDLISILNQANTSMLLPAEFKAVYGQLLAVAAIRIAQLLTAPQSGVRDGMLRAAEICKEWEAKLSQGAGYAIRTAREAITRAADQVNADQPADAVVVPSDEELSALSLDSWERKYHKVRKEISLDTWDIVYKRAYVEGFRAAQEGK